MNKLWLVLLGLGALWWAEKSKAANAAAASATANTAPASSAPSEAFQIGGGGGGTANMATMNPPAIVGAIPGPMPVTMAPPSPSTQAMTDGANINGSIPMPPTPAPVPYTKPPTIAPPAPVTKAGFTYSTAAPSTGTVK